MISKLILFEDKIHLNLADETISIYFTPVLWEGLY